MEIRAKDGAAIVVPEQSLERIHALAVVSELHPGLDGAAIVKVCKEASIWPHTLFQVLDLGQLEHLVAHSKVSQTLDKVLVIRCGEAEDQNTALIQLLAEPAPYSPEEAPEASTEDSQDHNE